MIPARMFHHRKNSQKPGADLLSQFQSSFDGVLQRRNSDGAHPTHFHSQDDAQLMTGEDSKHPPTLNLEGLPELDFSQSFNPELTPLSFLASQHPGCYTPRSSGMGAILHNQAGNRNSPNFNNFMMTPAPPIINDINNALDLGRPNAQCIAPQIVQAVADIQQPTYDHSAFTHQNLDHGPKNEPEIHSTTFDMFGFDPPANLGTSSVANSAANTNTPSQVSPQSVTSLEFPYPQGKRFRYHAALRTPTAMVKSAEEIPLSYLNKGQTYGLMIMDLSPPAKSPPQPLQYRTSVRITFDDEGQRLDPALYWRLWKESRGMDEARQEGRGLTAVEYASADGENSHIQIERVSLDGFCVNWIVEPVASTQFCTIPIRFRFLSTDFSYSKGVKGVPLRLCAKTELLSPKIAGTLSESEVCYCKVKLFRDHGAERKASNELRHVRKSIGKLEQEIEDVRLGGGSGKRRRANNTSTDMKDSGPRGNLAKNSLEDKLAISQGMLASSRTVTVLSLRGAAEDDPDIYPVQISAEQASKGFVKDEPAEDQDQELSDRPSPECLPNPSKPAARFFVRPSNEAGDVFRSIYLKERTVEDLTEMICRKYGIDRSSIVLILGIMSDGLNVIIDDDTVRKLPSNQVMVFDVCETTDDNGGHGLKEIKVRFE